MEENPVPASHFVEVEKRPIYYDDLESLIQSAKEKMSQNIEDMVDAKLKETSDDKETKMKDQIDDILKNYITKSEIKQKMHYVIDYIDISTMKIRSNDKK